MSTHPNVTGEPTQGPRYRVLVVTNMYPNADNPAYGVFVEDQVHAIEAAGLDVEVAFINGRSSPTAYLTGILEVRSRLANRKFDIVHAHYGLTGFVAAFQPLPLTVTFHGDDLLGTPSRNGGITLKSRIARFASRVAARRADALICVSAQLRKALWNHEDVARAHVIPGGIDIGRFFPGDRNEARKRLGLDQESEVVLFPSTPAERRKRLDLAKQSVAALNKDGRGTRLLVVSGLPKDEMPDYYRAADCLLLTSDWEGSPTVVKEALCCDLPVVTVDAGDAWEWLGIAPGCRKVEREVPLIAAGLREVLERGKRADGAQVRARLSWTRVVKDILRVYEESREVRHNLGR